MKKKVTQKIIMIVIVVILVLLGIIYYSENVKEISLIKNITVALNKQNENIKSNQITTIDVTNLEDNGKLEHEHIIKTKFDENIHWEECTICGQRLNEANHTYTSSWTMGSANACNNNNIYKSICTCGYITETTYGRKAHAMKTVVNTSTYQTYSYCTNCTGNVENMHDCVVSNGIRMNCLNKGICSVCGTNYSRSILYHYTYIGVGRNKVGENAYCQKGCSTYIGIVNKAELIKKSDSVYELHTNITVPNGSTFTGIVNENYFGVENVTLSNSTSTTGTNWSGITTINFIKHTELKNFISTGYAYNKNGISYTIYYTIEISIDEESPTIEVEKNSEELNQWSKTKPIVISGKENYCNTVTVKIIDDKGETIFEGNGNVNNGNYLVTCVPQIECDTIGRTFKAIVTDNLENSSEKEFTIAKVDCIPPMPTSGTEILGDWAKSKDFTFTATDYGIGQVSIAFNDIEDLKLATEDGKTFSRDYKFIGDVYSPKELSVMYKDGLGNTSIQKITIDKLDNTAPTITNTSIHNDVITIEAHDRHETLGEGSGVVKYRYLTSEEKLNNPDLNSMCSIESTKKEIKIKDIYKVKYIYVIAEDYVGNTSEVSEFKVPELILTSSVNLNTIDGKGEIILDWSSYDVSDKYFVVYRKKNNQTEWEKIVPLTQKLTGSTYTDKLGNDEAKPETPNITITGDTINNNINITANSKDRGTYYQYYIESYDSTGTLISKSN